MGARKRNSANARKEALKGQHLDFPKKLLLQM